MSDTSSSIHMLIDRPIVETEPTTFPSITFRDVPPMQLGAQCTVSIMGDKTERRAFAADLRAAADFVEAWERPVDPEPVEDAAVLA